MTSAIIDIICAIRNRSTFSPTHYQIGLLIAAIEDGDLIHVDQAAEHHTGELCTATVQDFTAAREVA